MKEVGGWLVRISTDYVFGKEPYNTPCKENQKGTPTGVYGATKLLGEVKIIATGCKHIIIRTAWLYSEFGKNFCKAMMNLTDTKPALKVVFEQCGTPTYAWDLATAIVAALKNPVEGVYLYSNEGVCSWFVFTKMIAEYCGNTECDIQPVHSNESHLLLLALHILCWIRLRLRRLSESRFLIGQNHQESVLIIKKNNKQWK